MKYVAFLRGINVGGNSIVGMQDLKKTFESIGLKNVRTILNSGNVIFESKEEDTSSLTELLEKTMEKAFKFSILAILKKEKEILSLINSNPFKEIQLTPETKFYVTFLTEKPMHNIKIPYQSEEKDFNILSVANGEICSVLTISKKRGTVEIMGFIEKEFGKKITTRNWNTINKIGKLLQS